MRKSLRDTIVEDHRRENYIRIYPAEGCDIYDKYFGTQKPLNKLIYEFLYKKEEPGRKSTMSPETTDCGLDSDPTEKPFSPSCATHRAVEGVPSVRARSPAKHGAITVGSPSKAPVRIGKATAEEKKILITGDDILIEYVGRLNDALSTIKEEWLDGRCLEALRKFVENPIWTHTSAPAPVEDEEKGTLLAKLQVRLSDMRARYNELRRHVPATESDAAEDDPVKSEETKREKTRIIRAFASEQLEHVLLKSARNSRCGAIDHLFISLSPAQGILSYIQRQFGRAKANKGAAAAGGPRGNRRLVRAQQQPVPQPVPCALPLIGEPRTNPGTRTQVACRSATSRSTGKHGSGIVARPANNGGTKMCHPPKERRSSFGNAVSRIKGMMNRGGEAAAAAGEDYSNFFASKGDGKVGDTTQKMFETLRASNTFSKANKLASANFKKMGL